MLRSRPPVVLTLAVCLTLGCVPGAVGDVFLILAAFIAVSLGYFETLMTCSAHSTSSELSSAEQQAAQISPGLIRLSIGYTGSLEQRWEQFMDALRSIKAV